MVNPEAVQEWKEPHQFTYDMTEYIDPPLPTGWVIRSTQQSRILLCHECYRARSPATGARTREVYECLDHVDGHDVEIYE